MKYLLFPILLLFTLQVRAATINISTTANPIPFNNVGFLSVGYNIQYGNPFPMARGIDPGFKTARIFNFDYSQSDTTYDLRYIVPQGVHLFKEVSCNLDFESEMISSQSDYQRTLAATLSVSGSARVPFGVQAAFRASAEAKSVYKGMESSSLTYIINTGECRTFRAHISESHPPPLHQAFLDDVRSLLGPNSPTRDYFRFISIYGTHYIKELVMGSRMTFINTITESTRKSWTESNQKYSLSASARYASVAEVSASGMFEEQISAAREFNTKVSSSSVSTIGSTPAPDGDLNTWAAQSTADPMPIQYALEPLSELFTPSFFANTDFDLSTIKTMKLGLDKALRDYCYELLSQGEVDRCDTPSSSPYNQTSFVDMNNDGNLDLVCDTTDGYHEVLINQKNGSVSHSADSDGPLNFLRSGVLRSWCDRLNGVENELTWVDFNGDNLKDAICDTARGTHHVMLNQGNDRFLPVGGSSDMLYDGDVPFVEYCVRTADAKDQPFWLDFNGDGLADLICNTHTGDVTVALNQGTFSMISIRNNTGGYWLTPLTESGILTGFCLSKAQDKSEAIWLDFDKDGYVDLICNGYKGDVSIFTNVKGNGVLKPIDGINGTLLLADKDGNLLGDVCTRDITRPSIPSWGNFDGDNYLEFYCSDANGYHMVFSYSSGNIMKRIFTHGPWWCFRSLLDFNIPLFMDMNNDSYDDLVCLDTNGALTIVFNNGIGGYSQANGVLQIDDSTTKQIVGFCPRKGLTKNNIIRLMDYDGNGFPDLVCSTIDEQHLVLLNTNGTNFKTLGGTATGAINSVVTGEPLTGWCSPK